MEDEFLPLSGPISRGATEGGLDMRFWYQPTLEHSVAFADITGDPNSIHRDLGNTGETIAPAFLQNVAAILASRKVMNEAGIDRFEFPRSFNDVILSNFVITGKEYEMLVSLRKDPLSIDIDLNDGKGRRVFRMERNFGDIDPSEENGPIYFVPFEGGDLVKFSEILGVPSPESNLFALASSSSALFESFDVGVLPEVDEGVKGVYTGQSIYLNVKDSISGDEEVRLSIPRRYDSKFYKGDAMEATVSLWRGENVVYQVGSKVRFESERLPLIAVKRSARRR